MTPDQSPSLHIFCDFDGTISGIDIGYDLFSRFGEREPWNSRLLEGSLDVCSYWRTMAQQLRAPFTEAMLQEYLRTIPVDPGLHELLDLVRDNSIPFTVVSDGFDLYIRRFLEMHGAGDLELFCNHATLDEHGAMHVSFPHAAEGCRCISAVCKRNVVLSSTPPGSRIIYIGDGMSDFCPSEHADIIFAKKTLAAYCNANHLPHYPFKTLSDVADGLRRLLARRRIRERHQAAIKRKGVWEGE